MQLKYILQGPGPGPGLAGTTIIQIKAIQNRLKLIPNLFWRYPAKTVSTQCTFFESILIHHIFVRKRPNIFLNGFIISLWQNMFKHIWPKQNQKWYAGSVCPMCKYVTKLPINVNSLKKIW